MKITAINIIDFGKFDEEIEIPEINPSMALFYGKNEAGKTTVFNLIKSMLYGFTPAKGESHPYASRKNGRIEFSGRLLTEEGELEVYRRLLSTPKGQLVTKDRLVELKNNALPHAEHISSEIYNKIYSLRVEDLIEIQGKAWEEVQDKLLANFGNELLRGTREVLKELREESAEIYRESGKGNYLIKDLENKLRDMKKEKTAAMNRQELLRKYASRLGVIKQLMESLINEKITLKASIKRRNEIMPVISLASELEELRRGLAKEELTEGLPAELREALQQLEAVVEKLNKELTRRQAAIEEKQRAIYEINTDEELVLENRHKINTYLHELISLRAVEDELKRLRQEIGRANRALLEEGKTLLKEEPSEEIFKRIRNINYLELQAQLGVSKRLQQQLREKKSILELKQQQLYEIKGSRLYVVAVVISLPLVIMAFLIKNNPILLVGGFIGFFGLTGLINNYKLEKLYKEGLSKGNNVIGLQKEVEELAIGLEKNTAAIKELLKGIPIPEIIVEHTQDVFLATMMRIKDLYQLMEEKRTELLRKEADYSFLRTQLEEFIRGFSFAEYKGLSEGMYMLKDRLDFLEKQSLINEGLLQELSILKEEVEEKQQQQTELKAKLHFYSSRLIELGGGNADEGLKLLEANNKRLNKIRLLEERMLQLPSSHKILEELSQIKQEGLPPELQLEKGELRLEDIEEELKVLKVEEKEIEINMQQLMDAPTVCELEGGISVLEEELQAAAFKRDRLILLSELIKRADEEFRLENQPDVLKKASKYFNIITEGRYTGIFLEDNDGIPAMYIREVDAPSPRRVSEAESKGTLNQLYLSLRLSLIDHLDRGKESLPICFDELLINWDEERLSNNLKLLQEISSDRQIFLFTCHEWMAEKIEKYFNVKRITLN